MCSKIGLGLFAVVVVLTLIHLPHVPTRAREAWGLDLLCAILAFGLGFILGSRKEDQ